MYVYFCTAKGKMIPVFQLMKSQMDKIIFV